MGSVVGISLYLKAKENPSTAHRAFLEDTYMCGFQEKGKY